MRGKLWAALSAALILAWLLPGCSGHHSGTAAVFASSRLEFEQAARQVLEQQSAQGVECPKGVQAIRFHRGDVPTVEFLCGADGFGGGTSYWGLNFTQDDVPVGFQGQRSEYWRKEGSGMRFYEVESDNSCYVERLEKSWFYFEARF